MSGISQTKQKEAAESVILEPYRRCWGNGAPGCKAAAAKGRIRLKLTDPALSSQSCIPALSPQFCRLEHLLDLIRIAKVLTDSSIPVQRDLLAEFIML